MAIPAWKRLEKHPIYQRCKLAVKRLLGREISLSPEVRIPVVRSGGWLYDPVTLGPGSVVYSVGVGRNIGFDVGLIRDFDVELHAFDPTPSSQAWLKTQTLPEQFHFHPWAVARSDGELAFYPRIRGDGRNSDLMYTLSPEQADVENAITVSAYAMPRIPEMLGHAHVDLLKLDIEGAEYEVLEGMLESTFRPAQILVEFHHRYLPDGQQRTLRLIARLRFAGYRLFAISETGREFSFRLSN